MSRSARKISSNGVYHVVLHSLEGNLLFNENDDYEKFSTVIKECVENFGVLILAYSFSADTVHLILKTGEEPLSAVVKKITTKYIFWYNKKYSHSGKLLHDRYKSEPLESNERIASAVRYVHSLYGLLNSRNEYNGEQNIADTKAALRFATKAELLKDADESESFIGEKNYAGKPISDEQVKKILSVDFACNSPEDVLILSDDFRQVIISRLHSAGASVRQISRLTGIGKNTVERKLKK